MTTTELTTLLTGLWTKVKSHVTTAINGLAAVATSGDYDDLTNKPTIPDVSGKQDKRTLVTTGSALTATTYVDFGTTDSVAPTLPATYERADEFLFTFVCSTDNCALTLPSGIDYGNGLDFDSDKKASRKFQVSISDGIALYAFVDQQNS